VFSQLPEITLEVRIYVHEKATFLKELKGLIRLNLWSFVELIRCFEANTNKIRDYKKSYKTGVYITCDPKPGSHLWNLIFAILKRNTAYNALTSACSSQV